MIDKPFCILAIACMLTAALSVFSSAANRSDSSSLVQTASCFRLGIPAYSYPVSPEAVPDFWSVLKTVPANSIYIMNPGSGTGSTIDPSYTAAIHKAKARHIVIYGYVDTAYARRNVQDVIKEAQRYVSWYQVDGIFLDETALDKAHLPYYKTISDALRKLKLRIAMNPGQPVIDPGSLLLADQVVTFEGDYGSYLAVKLPVWQKQGHTRQYWHLIYAVPDAAAMQQVVKLAAKNNAGVLYVAHDSLPNPWDGTPAYWQAELKALSSCTHAAQK